MGDYKIHFEDNKTTNGQSFYKTLYNKLKIRQSKKYNVVLFNISTNLWDIIKNKLKGKTIVVRVAALYFDKYESESSMKTSFTVNLFCKTLKKFGFSNALVSDVYNFFNRNYGVFIRVIFADYLIHQSNFSKKIMNRYFKHKPSTVIPNGALNRINGRLIKKEKRSFQLLTVYDSNRLSKRIYDLLNFVEYANTNNFPCELTVLGFDGKICPNYPKDFLKLLDSDNIILVPKFNEIDEHISEYYYKSDAFITFTYRDACPNIIVEAMSFSLPVIAFDSGGIRDLIPDNIGLLKLNDVSNYHVPHRYCHKFPKIHYKNVLKSLRSVEDDPLSYKNKIENIFLNKLEINKVADAYDLFLKNIN